MTHIRKIIVWTLLICAAGLCGCKGLFRIPCRSGCGVIAELAPEPCRFHYPEYPAPEMTKGDYGVSLVSRPRTGNPPVIKTVQRRVAVKSRAERSMQLPERYFESEEEEELTYRIPVTEPEPLPVITETPEVADEPMKVGGALPIPQPAVPAIVPSPPPVEVVPPPVPTPVPPGIPGAVQNLPPSVPTPVQIAPAETDYTPPAQ